MSDGLSKLQRKNFTIANTTMKNGYEEKPNLEKYSSKLNPKLNSKSKIKKPISTLELRKKLLKRKIGVSCFIVFVFLLWILFIQSYGAYLFTKGFLLSRRELDNKSSCDELPNSILQDNLKSTTLNSKSKSSCWSNDLKQFDKAVIIVIDALRFDFTVPTDSYKQSDNNTNYRNVFTFMNDLSEKNPQNARLFKFIADPPTTTLQRLKGLTTGSLPTFIDMGSNFAGSTILEDTWIHQLIKQNKSLSFMGDDTWLSLFPLADFFVPEITFPYDSLNVIDLHTVDNGVLEHIFPVLNSSPDSLSGPHWDVLIAHFLGVDHAGHRFGPDHASMKNKLLQMQNAIKSIISHLDDKTLLVVMGDHGMDPKGDHGGDSQDEVEAALFLYSKKPFLTQNHPVFLSKSKIDSESIISIPSNLTPLSQNYSTVYQIDLVSSLSLLLGLPIPFNNLGAPIPDVFLGPKANNYESLAIAEHLTAAQIHKYLNAYFGNNDKNNQTNMHNNDFLNIADNLFDKAQVAWKNAFSSKTKKHYLSSSSASSSKSWLDVIEKDFEFQNFAQSGCRAMWIKFDLVKIISGIFLFSLSILVLFIFATGLQGINGDLTHFIGEIVMSILKFSTAGILLVSVLQYLLKKDHIKFAESLQVLADFNNYNLFFLSTVFFSIIGFFYQTTVSHLLPRFKSLYPQNVWSFLSIFFVLIHAIIFSSNSFTIWEDRVVPYLLSTFALCAFLASFFEILKTSKVTSKLNKSNKSNKINKVSENSHKFNEKNKELSEKPVVEKHKYTSATLGMYHSIIFALLTRGSMLVRQCREEQASFFYGYFYFPNTSQEHLYILFGLIIVLLILPSIIASFYARTASYHAISRIWISYALRLGLGLISTYWILDTITTFKETHKVTFVNNDSLLEENDDLKSQELLLANLKYFKLIISRTLLGGSIVAGIFGWTYGPVNIDVSFVSPSKRKDELRNGKSNGKEVVNAQIFGFSNMYGSLYFLLILAIYLIVALFSKPISNLSLALYMWQLLTLFELLDILDLQNLSIGPILLGLLGHSYFFATGHQATIPSVQWDSGFICTDTLMFPITHFSIIMNTFGSHIIAALCVPLVVLWNKPPPFLKGTKLTFKSSSYLLSQVARALAFFALYHSIVSFSSFVFAAYFRRHLMVWKIFAPRYMLSGMITVLIDSLLVFTLGATWCTLKAIIDVFG